MRRTCENPESRVPSPESRVPSPESRTYQRGAFVNGGAWCWRS
ncbi:hypothetical protein [Xanthomonas translucens]|nr:hypothetical protein [Xanthomonas translucens]